jgi:uncharacterized protein
MLIRTKARVLQNVMVPMRDGVQLAVDIYLPPEDKGPVPALLALSAYGKNMQRQLLPVPMPSPLGDACVEAGWSDDFVERGYAHVIACTRGTGQSQGQYLSMYSKQESEDGYDLVEWIAAQPWCDSHVGMVGISYFGTIQLVVAASRPPHLKAIAPLEATTDQYLACYHGGVLDGFYSELFTGRHSSLGWSGFQPTGVTSWMVAKTAPAELSARVSAAKEDPDAGQYNLLWSVLDCPEKNPIFFDIMLNPHDDNDYWWNPDLSKIEIPVLCGCAWYPDCGPKFVRGPFMIWEGVRGPKKMLMSKAGWLERPFVQFHDELLAWFDYWLKGIDNGVMREAPLRLYINGLERYRNEHEWPLARTKWTDFYLRTFGRLSPTPERHENIPPDGYVQQPLSVTQTISSLRYSTGPLGQDLEVTGPVALYLYASIDATDSWFKATLLDVSPDGAAKEVTHGHLKCSHRKLDLTRSRPWQPIHQHQKEAIEPVVPGEVFEYIIELYPVAQLFRAGHQLVLDIRSGDLPGAQFSYHIMRAETVAYKVYRDARFRSRLHLPVIPTSV